MFFAESDESDEFLCLAAESGESDESQEAAKHKKSQEAKNNQNMTEPTTVEPVGGTPPTPDYDMMTAEQIELWAATATGNQLTLAILYESTHQNRAEVLQVLDAANAKGLESPEA